MRVGRITDGARMGNRDKNEAIARAKARMQDWQEQRQLLMQESRFDRCEPAELIRIAETGRDPEGQPLEGLDWAALDNAWRDAFGEPYFPSIKTKRPAPRSLAPVGQHPIMGVPDDTMLRVRDVVRLFGYAKTTLKRHRKSGSFPKAQRIAPGSSYIGWPARQLKAWVRDGGLDGGEDTTKH